MEGLSFEEGLDQTDGWRKMIGFRKKNGIYLEGIFKKTSVASRSSAADAKIEANLDFSGM